VAGCGDVRGAGGVAQWLLRVESSSSASEGAGGRAPRRGDQGGPQGWEGHLPANEDVRHAVEPMIEGDAIVDVDLRVPPLGQLAAMRGQRAHRGPVDGLEGGQTAGGPALTHFTTRSWLQAWVNGVDLWNELYDDKEGTIINPFTRKPVATRMRGTAKGRPWPSSSRR
jgi:hypothetical protein